MIKKLSFLIAVLSLLSVVMYGQRINIETVVVSNSVALHPLIFDVQKDGQNDIALNYASKETSGGICVFYNKTAGKKQEDKRR